MRSGKKREATQLTQNKNQLRVLDCAAPGLVRLRAPGQEQGRVRKSLGGGFQRTPLYFFIGLHEG